MDKKDSKEAEDLSFRQDELPADRSLVIVDDDKAFLQRLGRAMELRGFEVRMGSSIAEGLELIRQKAPAFAVVDMRLEDGNGLDVIAELAKIKPDARTIVLTGYGNFATAVSAVKLGAVDYLAKPADADEVTDALLAPANEKALAAGKPDVGGSRPLGAYPARLRAVQPQRLGDRATAQHASPHTAAHPGQAGAEIAGSRPLDAR